MLRRLKRLKRLQHGWKKLFFTDPYTDPHTQPHPNAHEVSLC